MLGQEKGTGESEKTDKSKPRPRGQKAGLLRSSIARVSLMGHMSLLFDDCCHCHLKGSREIKRFARSHGMTIVMAAALVFDLGQLCDFRAICHIAAFVARATSATAGLNGR